MEPILTTLILAIIGLELWGVFQHKRGKVDTISEIYWKWRNKLPRWGVWGVNIAMTGFLLWANWHFLFDGPS
ncbi:MAG: hypothetical protein ACWGQW_07925 [bacterium]